VDQLQAFLVQVRRFLFVVLLIEHAVVLTVLWLCLGPLDMPVLTSILLAAVVGAALVATVAYGVARLVMQPTTAIWQAVMFLMPHETGVSAPKVEDIRLGRELVANLTAHVYRLATNAEHADSITTTQSVNARAEFIEKNLPLPLLVLDADQTINFANEAACKYLGKALDDITGKNLYSVMDMSFPNDNTFDRWLSGAKEASATASQYWERVRLNVTDNQPTRLFDLASYYNKGNPHHNETMLVLFDHTLRYSQDDQAVSFIALSVHELRTPLTLLRGYIEAFEEELHDQLSPELKDFMFKMNATAQQLTAFVNNILNVARVDGDQLVLELSEENWSDIIKSAADTMALRAKVRGITVEYSIQPNLPTVGVDRISIHEVINNLIDNAIKYSGPSKRILVSTRLNNEGLVETTVQDWGVGIQPNIMANLFTKFYRDHRHRTQVGGTGLGLYLSKSIVSAHGGQIWVNSKEGQGSTFGFTLVPYAKLAAEMKNENHEIVRGAHGWIKNHSLYRR
jgi:signal transduction histidine kinase